MRAALRLLDEVRARYGPEKVAKWLLANPEIVPGCRKGFQAASAMHALEDFVCDVRDYMRKGAQPEPKCPGCNHGSVAQDDDTLRWRRGDAVYCSRACRQKAYRKRVTAAKMIAADKRNDSDGCARRSAPVAVTRGAAA